MRTPLRKVGGAALLAALAWLLSGTGGIAGDAKDDTWKPFVTEAAYKELLTRAVRAIQSNLDSKDKDDLTKAQVDAVRVAALSLSARDGNAGHLAAVRQRALLAAGLIKEGKDLAKARNVIGALTEAQGQPSKQVPDLSKLLDFAEFMNVYRMKSKGGEGIAPALQSSGPLKKQNGIEEKLRYLVRKKLAPAKLAMESDELALLAYKMAVDGALTATFAAAQKKDQRDWREYSLAMRDMAAGLAEAAKKADPEAVQKAAVALENSCTQCHRKFRQAN
jgi:cytochrome c556